MDMLAECEGFRKRSIRRATLVIFVCDTGTWQSANTQLPTRVRRTVTVREQQPISSFQRVVMQAFLPILCRTSETVAVCVEPLLGITWRTVYLPQNQPKLSLIRVFWEMATPRTQHAHTHTHTHNKHTHIHLTSCENSSILQHSFAKIVSYQIFSPAPGGSRCVKWWRVTIVLQKSQRVSNPLKSC